MYFGGVMGGSIWSKPALSWDFPHASVSSCGCVDCEGEPLSGELPQPNLAERQADT